MSSIEFITVETPNQLAQLRFLFVEYARSLSYHICFDTFEQELAQLPGFYGPPNGRLMLVVVEGQPAGCVALREKNQNTGEIKRLYVRPAFRGQGLGRSLAERVIADARQIGYTRLCLDTLPSMTEARALYLALGFQPVQVGNPSNPAGSAGKPIDMELNLI